MRSGGEFETFFTEYVDLDSFRIPAVLEMNVVLICSRQESNATFGHRRRRNAVHEDDTPLENKSECPTSFIGVVLKFRVQDKAFPHDVAEVDCK